MKKKHNRIRPGFTLVELIVVGVILAVMAMVVIPTFIGRIGQAKQNVAVQKLTEIVKAIEMFSYDYGRLPENIEDLVTRPADIPEDEWNHPTLKAKDLIDPWERHYIYKQPGDHGPYDLYSLGKDSQEGGEDEDADAVNW